MPKSSARYYYLCRVYGVPECQLFVGPFSSRFDAWSQFTEARDFSAAPGRALFPFDAPVPDVWRPYAVYCEGPLTASACLKFGMLLSGSSRNVFDVFPHDSLDLLHLLRRARSGVCVSPFGFQVVSPPASLLPSDGEVRS